MPCRTVLRRALGVTLGSALLVSSTAFAQTHYSVVSELNDPGFARPMGGVISVNGVLYGTAHGGGGICGGVFKVTPDGESTPVHTFTGADGCNPVGELVRGSDGHLYGTTSEGGPNVDTIYTSGTGTIFRISLPDETFSPIHSFAGKDQQTGFYLEGARPYAGLTVGTDGNLYGTTSGGGSGSAQSGAGCGTVFQVSPSGVPVVLHSFAFDVDGCGPNAGVTVGPDGNLYGTTAAGGSAVAAGGTVFKVTPAGAFTNLFEFIQTGPNGWQPAGEPVFDRDGNMYGTASAGGPPGTGSGTVWRLTPTGTMSVLKAFTGSGGGPSDGAFPFAGLTWGSDGLLYGVTHGGGENGSGAMFRVTTTGTFERLHSFDQPEGAVPDGRLLETAPGVFMGTTNIGGAPGGGVVFRLTVPVVDVDLNGLDGPLTLHTGDPFQLTIAYQTNDAGIVNPARIYIGVLTPSGLYWLRPTGFSTVQGTLYSGPLPAIPPATLLNLPNAAALPAGRYLWFMLVDVDGPGDAFDYVDVTVSP